MFGRGQTPWQRWRVKRFVVIYRGERRVEGNANSFSHRCGYSRPIKDRETSRHRMISINELSRNRRTAICRPTIKHLDRNLPFQVSRTFTRMHATVIKERPVDRGLAATRKITLPRIELYRRESYNEPWHQIFHESAIFEILIIYFYRRS